MKSPAVLIVATSLLIGSASLDTAAAEPTQWSRYMPQKERRRTTQQARFDAEVRDVGNQPLVVSGAVLGHTVRLGCLWITESVARSIVSYRIDHRQVTSTDAEQEYGLLRRPTQYLVILSSHGAPLDGMSASPRISLVVGTNQRTVVGTVIPAPYEIMQLRGVGPMAGKLLIAFPKLDTHGRQLVQNLQDQCYVRLEYPARTATIQIKLDRLVSSPANL